MINQKEFPKYNQKQIDAINQEKNSRHCLVIIFGVIYDLYKFSSVHPGGEKLIMQAAGDILDEIITDGNHRFTQPEIEKRLKKYKYGLFETNHSVNVGESQDQMIQITGCEI